MLFGSLLTGLSFVVLLFSNWIGIIILGILLMTLGEMIAFPFSNAFAMKQSRRGKQGQYMAFLHHSFFHIARVWSQSGIADGKLDGI